MDASQEILAARAKLAAKFGNSRTGGKGSVRRKRKTTHKSTTNDDKKLQSVLKRLGVNQIPAIEEVNMFKEDNSIIHFVNPRVSASIASNTYCIQGTAENKQIQDLLPGIIPQLLPENVAALKDFAAQMGAAGAAAPAAADAAEDDDDMPELVESFEDVSEAQ